MRSPPAEIGARVEDIDTPALMVELDAFERNLTKMAKVAEEAGVRLRPHAKTHKCPEIAKRQIALGAVGQCVQKVGEAEALASARIRDILVSNEIVGEAKLRRLARLAETARIALCFDAVEQVEATSRIAREHGVELGGLVEIEVGMERCGVPAGAPARDLARRIAEAPHLRFEGLQAYHGRAQHLATADERRQAIDGAIEAVRATLDALAADGLPCANVSGAGTGTFRLEAASGVYNELQVGSYVFMDTDYARIGGADGGLYRELRPDGQPARLVCRRARWLCRGALANHGEGRQPLTERGCKGGGHDARDDQDGQTRLPEGRRSRRRRIGRAVGEHRTPCARADARDRRARRLRPREDPQGGRLAR